MNNDGNNKGSPTLIITTVLVLLVVSMLGGFLFIMRSRTQGRWLMQQRALRAQEWVRKMEELGIGVNIPALHEVVLGGARADPWGRDLTKFNERTWNDLMPLSATRKVTVGTASHPMLQVVTLLRMPIPKPPKHSTHKHHSDTTLIDEPQQELDLGFAVYSSRRTIF